MKNEANIPGPTADATPAFPPTRESVGGEIPSALREKLLGFRELVFRISLGLCRNQADAQDLTQETYCKAFARPSDLLKLNGEEHLKLWLCRVARTTCLDHLRRTRRQTFFGFLPENQASPEPGPEARELRTERLALLHRALLGLPGRQRDVLVLREYGQLSYREISGLLGIREGTIMSILLRARRKVHASVKEALHERER
jgi:RNA polymerase sigma-70 factor (ECF subfamily)